MSNKLLVICGPTGVGKTSLAIKLAKQFNGEIVSADSRQVYRYMDIGTGKDVHSSKFKVSAFTPVPDGTGLRRDKQIGFYEIDGIKVWLYDVVKPDYQFSVADYIECTSLVMKDIWKRGKLPILVGGTGFYIKALVDGIETIGIKPDWGLRKILGYQDIKILREMLGKLDAERLRGMNESDKNNPRRLIRAIEIARHRSTSEVSLPPNWRDSSTSEVKSFFIGLKASYKELYERIDKRVDERVAQGVEKEIRGLLEKGYTFENSALGTTIGYKEWQPLLDAEIQRCRDSKMQTIVPNVVEGDAKEEVIERWKYNEHGYARRQMTWFKKTPMIHWFDIIEPDCQQKIARLVKEWYH